MLNLTVIASGAVKSLHISTRFCDEAQLLLSCVKTCKLHLPWTVWPPAPLVIARRIEEIVEIFTQCRSGHSTGTPTHVFLELFPLVTIAHHLLAATARRAGRRGGCCARVNIAPGSRAGGTQLGCHTSILHFFGEIHDALRRNVVRG